MPWHFQPIIRNLERAEEAEGLIKTLNSVGFTVQAAEEAAGKKPSPPVPVGVGHIIRGTTHANAA